MQKIALIVTATVIAGIAAAAVIMLTRSDPRVPLSPAMLNIEGADIGGPFTLVARGGREVTDKDVIDRPSLLYFGYTFCPDVCPVDVQAMADTVDVLADRGVEVTPVFITVDPARDTAEELAIYAEAMHPRMIALTGSDEQIAAAATAYRVIYKRQDVAGSAAGYLMQHTNFTYLVHPEHGLIAMFRSGFPPEDIASDIERVLSAY